MKLPHNKDLIPASIIIHPPKDFSIQPFVTKSNLGYTLILNNPIQSRPKISRQMLHSEGADWSFSHQLLFIIQTNR